MESPVPTIFVVSPSDPWSIWSVSGITRAICLELQERGLLRGAIGADAVGNVATRVGPTGWLASVGRRMHRLSIWKDQKQWDDECQGQVGRALSGSEPGTTVLYCFLTPKYDPLLNVRRFRFMDLSLSDAIRTGAYGHAGLCDAEVQEKKAVQLKALCGAEGVVTLSTHAADAISHDYGYPRDKITAIGSGPALPFSPPSTQNAERYGLQRILFLGRAWERKGGPLLLEAFRLLRRKMPKATLVVAGPPKRPTNEPGVEYHPPINKGTAQGRAKIDALYNGASVFCMPSLCETWGLVYVEASQRRTPVVGFSEWALPDIVQDGVTGLLATDRSAQSLAELLRRALSDPKRIAAMGLAAEKRVREVLDWPHVVDRLLHRISPATLEGRGPVWLQGQ